MVPINGRKWGREGRGEGEAVTSAGEVREWCGVRRNQAAQVGAMAWREEGEGERSRL
jgi:hypothetical protein